MIRSFKSNKLRIFFEEGDSSAIEFEGLALIEVADILFDLNDLNFSFEDFQRVWHVRFYGSFYSVSVTVNGVEPCGSICFNYQDADVFEVDYYVEL